MTDFGSGTGTGTDTGRGRTVGTRREGIDVDPDDVTIDLRGPETVIDLSDNGAAPDGGSTRTLERPAPPPPAVEAPVGSPDRRRRRRRLDVALLIGALVVLLGTSAFMAHTVAYAPDESSHWLVVQHYADDLSPMSWQQFEYGAARGHPYHLYSPLPYAPYVPAAKLGEVLGPVASATRPVHFLPRLGGLLVAAAQFALTVALVRRMTRSHRLRVSIAVALVVNLLPSLRFIHSYMNADALTIAAGTLCALVALRVLQRSSASLGDAVLVGLSVGLAGLSRYQALPMALLPVGALVWRVARDHQAAIRPRLRLVGLAAAISLVLALPVQLAVMTELANGHVSASADHEALRVDTFDGRPADDLDVGELVSLRRSVIKGVWGDTWANVARVARLSDTRLRWLTAIAAVGLAGLLVPPRRVLTPTGRAVALASLAAGLATLLIMSAQWPFDLAGRFMLPAGVPLLCGAVLGTAELISRYRRVRHPTRIAVGAWGTVLGVMLAWILVQVAVV